MSAPSLMVLYTNDAVEVRYSDGSHLQLSPCGTSVLHHDRPQPGQHPLAGLRKIQQRCRYVTSEYSNKVLQALDFRNRFAERPYLCQDLLIKEDVVPLYADIREVAWSKTVDKSRSEFLPDGSVRIFSSNEFASLSLSQHRRDFTVCYLSKISQEPTKNKSFVSRKSASSQQMSSLQNISGDTVCDDIGKLLPPSGSHSASNTIGKRSEGSEGFPQTKVPGAKGSSEDRRPEQCNVDPVYTRISTPTNFAECGHSGDGEPVVTPFGRTAVFHKYGGGSTEVSPASHEISSISKTSSDGLCTTLDIDVTVGHDASLEHRSASPILPGQNSSGSQGNDSKSNSTGDSFRSESSMRRTANVSRESEKSVQFADDSGGNAACQYLYTWVTRHISCNECPTRWSHALKLAGEKSNNRRSDVNTNEPTSDIPPANLHVPVKVNKKQCVMSPLPAPLALTCPSQHRHKWAPVDPDEEEVDRFNTGRLKVVMVDGIIYRLIHLPAMKVMELYPGDGSVFISQGVTGQFFSQIIPAGDKLDERTYSVRTLPPPAPSAKYPLEKMLKRAGRLLCEAVQRDKLSHSEEPPCWKVEPLPVLEPLSVSVLEEVYIPGVGRFTAHTNGRVRVVFDDRTSLDMVCNFSQRIEECAHHSAVEVNESAVGINVHTSMTTATGLDGEIDSGTCRLLLPSGKYILVNKMKPGTYHRYVSQALEWASWVNASPLERKQFYEKLGHTVTTQGTAAAELQKINCFNYILENTVLSSRPLGHGSHGGASQLNYNSNNNNSIDPPTKSCSSNPTSFTISQDSAVSNQFRPIQDVRTQNRSEPMTGHPSSSLWHSGTIHNPTTTTVPTPCFPQPIRSSVLSTNLVTRNQTLYPSNHLYPSNQLYPSYQQYPSNQLPSWESSKERSMAMLEGFNSVRHALLQTNKLIHDIDDMLDNKS